MESDLPVIDNLRDIFLNDIPLLDVRAPVEFAQGSFPGTINSPLIDDDERDQIGKKYKDAGQDAAIELGLTLVKGEKKQQRIESWKKFAEQNPTGLLFCFRGGLRSKTSQKWLFEHTGLSLPRITGGYKAMRRFLIDQLEDSEKTVKPIVIGGRTGCGKTRVLNKLPGSVDLEGMAWHRGSAFGHHATPQPTQINFENTLAIALLKHQHSHYPNLIVEDEGKHIGSVHIPLSLRNHFQEAPLVILVKSTEERVHITHEEYIHQALKEYQNLHGETLGFEKWSDYLLSSTDKIKRRLGGERHLKLRQTIEKAIQVQKNSGDTDIHKQWIENLLSDYYDPMYDYQIKQKQSRIIFSGSEKEVIDFINSRNTTI